MLNHSRLDSEYNLEGGGGGGGGNDYLNIEWAQESSLG